MSPPRPLSRSCATAMPMTKAGRRSPLDSSKPYQRIEEDMDDRGHRERCCANSWCSSYRSVVRRHRCAPPGVYFGSGNVNGNYTIDTANNVEAALRAKNRDGAQQTIDGSSGVYQANAGTCGGGMGCSGSTKALELRVLGQYSGDRWYAGCAGRVRHIGR